MIYNENGIILEKVDTKKRNKGNLLRKFVSDYVLFDLEATSKYLTAAKIIEIAAVKVQNNKIVDTFETFVNPGMRIPAEIVRLTGITDNDVKDEPTISDVLPEFIKFIGNDILVGHNINTYDLNIIYDLALDLLGVRISNDYVDTCDLCRCLAGLDLQRFNLGILCDYFNVTNKEAHRAMSDVIANHEVYQKMKAYKIESYKFPGDYKQQNVDFNFAVDVMGKRICLTGEFKCADRKYIKEKLIECGAKVTNNISIKTDYLIVGDLGTTTTHKIDDANSFGTKVYYEKDFILPNN